MTSHVVSVEPVTDSELTSMGLLARPANTWANELLDTAALVAAFSMQTPLVKSCISFLVPENRILANPQNYGHHEHDVEDPIVIEIPNVGQPVPDWAIVAKCNDCVTYIILQVADTKRLAAINATSAEWAVKLIRIPNTSWNESILPNPQVSQYGWHLPADECCEWHRLRKNKAGLVMGTFEGQNDLYRGWCWQPQNWSWLSDADQTVFMCFHLTDENPFKKVGLSRNGWDGLTFNRFMRSVTNQLHAERIKYLSDPQRAQKPDGWLTPDVCLLGNLLRALLAPPPPRGQRKFRAVLGNQAVDLQKTRTTGDLWRTLGRMYTGEFSAVRHSEIASSHIIVDAHGYAVIVIDADIVVTHRNELIFVWRKLIEECGWHLVDSPCEVDRCQPEGLANAGTCGHINWNGRMRRVN